MSLATLLQQDTRPSKVHFSQYLRTENESTDETPPPEAPQPEKPEAA